MIAGGCLCGAVRYEAAGEPKFSVLCYCRDCQKVSGSAYVPAMGMPEGSVTVTGETKSYALRGASGKMAIRHFCPACGSLLFGAAEDRTGSINLYIGTLDDPSVFKPSCAIFARSRPDWEPAANTIPAFEALLDSAAVGPHRQGIRFRHAENGPNFNLTDWVKRHDEYQPLRQTNAA